MRTFFCFLHPLNLTAGFQILLLSLIQLYLAPISHFSMWSHCRQGTAALLIVQPVKAKDWNHAASSEMVMGREGREGTVAMPSELLFLQLSFLSTFRLKRSTAHKLGLVIPSSTLQMTTGSQTIIVCHSPQIYCSHCRDFCGRQKLGGEWRAEWTGLSFLTRLITLQDA